MRKTEHKDKKIVVTLALITAICLLGDSMLYIALPIYWREVGLDSLWEVGLLLSANRLIRIPLNPLIGWIYTKITLQQGLLIAVCLTALTTTGYGLAQGLWLWLIIRCLWGIAWSFLRIGGFYAIVKVAEYHNRGQLMGVYNGLYRLGSLFGMLFGGILVSLFGLTSISIGFGLLALIGFPFILSSVHPAFVLEEEKKGPANSQALQWRSAAILKVLISGFCLALLIQGVLTSTLSYMIEAHFSREVLLLGMIISVSTLSGLIQGIRWAWEPFLAAKIGEWSDGSLGRMPFFLVSLFVAACTFALLPWSIPIYWWLLLIVLLLLSATALTTLSDALASDEAKKTNALALMTLYSVALDLGAALGPLLAYLILRVEHGLIYTYLGGAGLFLAVACLWMLANTKKKEKWLLR